MHNSFDFVEDEDVKRYYVRIAQYMVGAFGISEAEATQRVAYFAKRVEPKSGWLILHRSEQYWAQGLYYKHDERGELTQEPRPVPPDDD